MTSSGRSKKSPSIPAAGLLRAAHRCSRSASWRCAIAENEPCGGNESPAYARRLSCAIRALRVLVNKVGTIARMNHAGIPV
jgi:hypothetical protein